MKDCCQTNKKKPDSKVMKWIKRSFWGIIILLVISMAIIQIFKL